MTQDLLVELHRRGIRLRLVDDRLDVVAPAGALTPGLRAELKARRDELLAVLRGVPTEGARPELVPAPKLRHEPFPLTDVQHAYWVGRRPAVELGGVATYVYTERERAGLDLDRLERALHRVIARHDMLRTVVLPDGRQRALPQSEVAPYPIAVDDLRGLPAAERTARLAATRAAMDHQVLPTDRCPLFDIRASLLDEDRIRLHIGLDIMVTDGFSMYVLFREWQRFYEDPGWAPEPLELSFRDVVVAEEEAREGAAYRKAEAYWRELLPELPPAPALPLAVQPGQLGRPVFAHRHGRLAAERWRTVKAGARERGLTPSAVLMTAYAEVLRLWSQQSDFTVNLTLLNRPPVHRQIGELIGDFTSTTLLADPARPGEPFTARARLLQERLLRDLEHAAFNGVRVLRERSRAEGGGPGAGMPVVFTAMILTGEADDPAAGMDFFGELVHQISQTPQVWLDHQVTEEHGDLVYNWDAVDGLFPEGLLDDMFTAFGRLVGTLADDPAAWDAVALTELPAWQADVRRRVNGTAQEIPERTLYELVADTARRTPGATAVITERGAHTYGELLARAHRLARVLVRHGAARDTLVGVVLDKGFDQVAAVLGVAASGAAYLPVDPGWPAERRRLLLEQGGVRTVVTSAPSGDGLPEGVRVLTLDDEEVRAAGPGPLGSGPAPGDLAYVIFTSGSTGRPKGVMIDHRAAANTIQDLNSRFAVGASDRVLGLSALSFDLSVYDVFGVLAAGGAVVLPTPGREHDPAHWADLVRRHRVTVWNSVPALMQAWTESPAAASGGDGLRLVLLSGDWIPVALPDAVRAVHPGARVVGLGGATEASIWSVFHPIGDVPAEWTRIPYGRPLANQRLHVLHADFRPCPVWTPGEILIGGAGLARGYWADPERTAERFVTHPETGEPLYRTGDLGRYLPSGDIDFLGRMDFQVKLNGYRIELGEIEAVLRARPEVAEAFASVRTSPRTGRRQLVGHVVPAPGEAPGAPALRAALEEVLPGYMVPHHLLLVDRVPLSANGKVDRAALPDPWQEEDAGPRAAPRGELERLLLKLWSEVLGDQEFGVDDNFFELGGDSLHAVRILGLIHTELGIEQQAEDDLEMLFDHPTIAELARALTARTGQ